MSVGWENIEAAPIVRFESQAQKRFHALMDSHYKIDGKQLAEILREFTTKVCNEYNINTTPVAKAAENKEKVEVKI